MKINKNQAIKRICRHLRDTAYFRNEEKHFFRFGLREFVYRILSLYYSFSFGWDDKQEDTCTRRYTSKYETPKNVCVTGIDDSFMGFFEKVNNKPPHKLSIPGLKIIQILQT